MIWSVPKHGFALPLAIFLMVIVSMLVVSMARLLSSESALTNLGLLGVQAHWSAHAANEWASYHISRTQSCPTPPANYSINNFAITFSCNAVAYSEGGNSGQLFYVSSVSEWGSDPVQPDYVSRTLEVVLDVQ